MQFFSDKPSKNLSLQLTVQFTARLTYLKNNLIKKIALKKTQLISILIIQNCTKYTWQGSFVRPSQKLTLILHFSLIKIKKKIIANLPSTISQIFQIEFNRDCVKLQAFSQLNHFLTVPRYRQIFR